MNMGFLCNNDRLWLFIQSRDGITTTTFSIGLICDGTNAGPATDPGQVLNL